MLDDDAAVVVWRRDEGVAAQLLQLLLTGTVENAVAPLGLSFGTR